MTTKYEEDAKKVLLGIERICIDEGLAKAEFYRIYCRECVHPSAQNDEVERFVDRIEKIKPNQRGCIDRLGPMLDFGQRKYCGGVLMIDEQSKQAAWEYFVEINTRVINSRSPINLGCPKAALSSLHTLFERVRALAEDHYKSRAFFWFVEPFFNGVLREFTTRWHKQSVDGNINSKLFWNELTDLREKVSLHCQDVLEKFHLSNDN